MKQLTREQCGGATMLDRSTCEAVQAAIFVALGKLQGEGFQSVSSRLSDVEQLRKVEERLNALRGGLAAPANQKS
jgi:hypothetical protein